MARCYGNEGTKNALNNTEYIDSDCGEDKRRRVDVESCDMALTLPDPRSLLPTTLSKRGGGFSGPPTNS